MTNIYIKRQDMEAIEKVEPRNLKKGTLYYHVPEYGYVCVSDLYNVKCASYTQKQALVSYLDSVVKKQDGSDLYIQIHLFGD